METQAASPAMTRPDGGAISLLGLPVPQQARAARPEPAADYVKRNQEAQKLFRDDYMFIPWYSQTMSRWANANVKGMEKNLDWQVVAPWDIVVE